MKTLFIDTSTFDVVVGLANDHEMVLSIQEEASKQQSELTIPILDTILKQVGWQLNMIDEIVLTLGPGSYTGVRIAMTIAKTMAVVKKEIKLYGLSTLQAYSGLNEHVCTLIDARSQKYFLGTYHNGQKRQDDQLIDASSFVLKDGYTLNDCTKSIKHIDVAKNMLLLKNEWQLIGHVHQLVPVYLKEVEAKRLDQKSNPK